jgi:ribosomal-protein-alanine acetyltransferase
VIVRAATADDLAAIKAIEQASAGASHWSMAQYAALLEPSSAKVLLVGCEGERVLGFLVGQSAGLEWEVENVVVEASQQRTGTGTALMREFVDLARGRDANAVFLEVRDSNPARLFYERMQFVAVGRRVAYYHDPLEDAVIYRLMLK